MKLGKNLTILNSKEIKEIRKMLTEQFGIDEKFDFVFLRNTKDKLYVVNREIELINFEDFWIDSAGMYFGRFQIDGFRPSVEGAQFLYKYATKNVVELTQEQKHEWLMGRDITLEKENEDRIVLVKSGVDILGSGKIKNKLLLNALPKARRLNTVNEELDSVDELEDVKNLED